MMISNYNAIDSEMKKNLNKLTGGRISDIIDKFIIKIDEIESQNRMFKMNFKLNVIFQFY